ncbi:hypothetical protein ACH5RR_021614 [Cinchona calisaya]|uniref:Uncharacterized protein n=1 Tax=Cinchona calisaya TaxID=153742 RepID=A0ABD2ZL16_9GENT
MNLKPYHLQQPLSNQCLETSSFYCSIERLDGPVELSTSFKSLLFARLDITFLDANIVQVMCYTNVIGQTFFTMEDLLGYVDYAKRQQLSIYKPFVLTGEKMDDGATSSYKGKGIITSSLTRPIPLRASRRLAECDPEIAPSMDLEKALELKTMDDLITCRDHGQKQDGDE